MEQADFYGGTLRTLIGRGVLRPDMRVLVVCGGHTDRDALLATGFTDVVISNLDTSMVGSARPAGATEPSAEYAPYCWSLQDAEGLTFPDGSFDACIVHAGLHHCRSPHRALLEMYRVAREVVLFIEPVDNTATRLGLRLGIGQDYEHGSVWSHKGTQGGVRNSPIPNYVYRWTRRDVEQTIRCADPTGEPTFHYFTHLALPLWQLAHRRNPLVRWGARLLGPMVARFGRHLLANNIAVAIVKPQALHPWLARTHDGIGLDTDWLRRRYG